MATRRKRVTKKSTETVTSPCTLGMSADGIKFLRDLFSVMVPPDGELTVSQSLAQSTGREKLEEELWQGIIALCKENDIPTGNDAEDYAIVPVVMTPPMTVVRVEKTQEDG